MLDIRPAQYATDEVKQIFLARKFSWKKSIIEIRLMFCMIKNIELQIAKGKINNYITFFVINEKCSQKFSVEVTAVGLYSPIHINSHWVSLVNALSYNLQA